MNIGAYVVIENIKSEKDLVLIGKTGVVVAKNGELLMCNFDGEVYATSTSDISNIKIRKKTRADFAKEFGEYKSQLLQDIEDLTKKVVENEKNIDRLTNYKTDDEYLDAIFETRIKKVIGKDI